MDPQVDATMRDVFLAVRADEACHSYVVRALIRARHGALDQSTHVCLGDP